MTEALDMRIDGPGLSFLSNTFGNSSLQPMRKLCGWYGVLMIIIRCCSEDRAGARRLDLWYLANQWDCSYHRITYDNASNLGSWNLELVCACCSANRAYRENRCSFSGISYGNAIHLYFYVCGLEGSTIKSSKRMWCWKIVCWTWFFAILKQHLWNGKTNERERPFPRMALCVQLIYGLLLRKP